MRLIDADDLLERFKSMKLNCKANYAIAKYIGKIVFEISESTVDICSEEVKRSLTVDAVPVVHGRWVKQGHYPPECSVCGGIAPKDCEGEEFYQSDFCQSCGADMRERAVEGTGHYKEGEE